MTRQQRGRPQRRGGGPGAMRPRRWPPPSAAGTGCEPSACLGLLGGAARGCQRAQRQNHPRAAGRALPALPGSRHDGHPVRGCGGTARAVAARRGDGPHASHFLGPAAVSPAGGRPSLRPERSRQKCTRAESHRVDRGGDSRPTLAGHAWGQPHGRGRGRARRAAPGRWQCNGPPRPGGGDRARGGAPGVQAGRRSGHVPSPGAEQVGRVRRAAGTGGRAADYGQHCHPHTPTRCERYAARRARGGYGRYTKGGACRGQQRPSAL
jgi:hypothetical protein